MYEITYKLSAEPFRLSPDPRFCFEHRSYRKAMTYMRHGLHRAEGFIMITGRPGTGKTTLISDLLRTLKSDQVMVANLVTTQLTADNLLRLVAYSFNLNPEGADKVEVLMQVSNFLKQQHQQGRRPLLIVDEAQSMAEESLEELRLLTNIQVDSQQLLQIFLVGQEQLRDIVNAPGMEQLRQRMIAATHLETLDRDDTEAYIKHRLRSVAWTGDPLISEEAYTMIQQYSQGIPRQINQICSRLLLHGSIEEKHRLGVADVEIVIEELRQESLMPMDTSVMFTAPQLSADQDSDTYIEEPRHQTAPATPKTVQRRAPTTAPATKHRQETEPVRPKTEPAPQKSTTAAPATRPAMPENKPAAKPSWELLSDKDLKASASQERQQPTVNSTWIQQTPAARMAAAQGNATQNIPAAKLDNRAPNQKKFEPRKARWPGSWGLLLLAWLITGLAIAVMYLINPELTRQTGKNLMTWAHSGIEKGISFVTGQESPDITELNKDMGGTVANERSLPVDEKKNNDAVATEITEQEPDLTLQQTSPAQLEEELQQKQLPFQRIDDETLKVNLGTDAMFAFDSPRMKGGAHPELDKLADVLHKHSKLTIQVVGHTDPFGTAEYDLNLTQLRAKAVADYLAMQNHADLSILSEGRGARDTSNEHLATYDPSLKRRIEIYIRRAVGN